MKKVLKIFGIILSLAIVGILAYSFRGLLQNTFTRLEGVYSPCQRSITYSIGLFDKNFGISEDYFLSALRDAEAIWEKPIGRELFIYDPAGNLKINLIYDYRQEATAKLQKLGLTVNDDQASYNTLKAKYNAFNKAYASDKAAYEVKLSDYETRQSAYEKEVARWNSQHGAPKDVYDRLNVEKAALDAEAADLDQSQVKLNEEVDNINALVVVLNRLVGTLNLSVSKFNAVGKTLGGEFEEGDYQSGPNGQQIDIYEFSDRNKLVRVLAHELGHALGLAHVDDPKAIMYRLNNGINDKLTATDLAALKKLCGLPTQAGLPE